MYDYMDLKGKNKAIKLHSERLSYMGHFILKSSKA